MQAKIRAPGGFWLQWAFTVLLTTGVACLTLFFWFQFESRYFQASLSQEFEEQRNPSGEKPDQGFSARSSPREPAPPKQRSQALAGVIGRLEIPRIGMEVMVLEGSDPSTLRRGAGWLPQSAQPGAGNAAIAAHRDTYFRPLRQIKEGDTIRLVTLDATYDFQVEWAAVVDPDDTAVLDPTSKPALTLITCYPFNYVGSAPQRFVVRATRQEPLASAAAEMFGAGAAQCPLDATGGPGSLAHADD